MSKIRTPQGPQDLPPGAKPDRPLPVQTRPEWQGQIPIETAEQLAAIPGYEKDPNVIAFNEYQAGLTATTGPSTEHQAATSAFEQEAFDPRATPPPTGRSDVEINPLLTDVYSESPAAPVEVEAPQNLVGITGEDLSASKTDHLARQETRRQQQQFRQNDMASRIAAAEDIDASLKSQGVVEASRTRAIGFIDSIANSLGGIEVEQHSAATQKVPGPSSIENGLGRLLNRINENESDTNNIITPSALSAVLAQSVVRNSKILAAKANKEALPEGDSSDPLASILDASGLTSIEEVGAPTAFHDELGLVGIQKGSLGGRILGQVADSVRQARGAERGPTFDQTDALVLEEALIDAGYIVPGTYIVRDSKGEATKKSKELSQEHEANFMTRKMFDAVKGLAEYSQLDDIKLGAQAITDSSGEAIGEGKLYGPKSKPKPKGKGQELKGKKNETVFTKYQQTYKKAFRAYDNQVQVTQGLGLSALQTYLTTPLDQRATLPENLKTLAHATAKTFDFKLYASDSKEITLDPNAATKKEKLAFFNAMQKLGNISKQVADGVNLQGQLPDGHRVGGAMHVDPTVQRQYTTAYNSSEQNSLAQRGALRGHDRKITRTRIMESTSSTAPLLTEADINRFVAISQGKTKPRQGDYEVAFILSAARALIPGSKTKPDVELLPLITPQLLMQGAKKHEAMAALGQLGMTPENLQLLGSNPEKMVLDQQGLQQISNAELKGALGFMNEVERKHAGQTQQLFRFLHDYMNSDQAIIPAHILDISDMISAGRTQAAVHAGTAKGAQLVSYQGWYITESAHNPEANQPVADGVDYTTQNPRMFTVKNTLDILEMKRLDKRDKGEEGGIEAAVLDSMTDFMTTDKAPDYADTFAKLGNMVLEYGMGLGGSTDKMISGFVKALDKWQKDLIEANDPKRPLDDFDARLKSEGYSRADLGEALFDVFSGALLEVGNLGYAQALSRVHTAGAMLGLPAVLVGYDGQVMPVGKVGRKKIYGETAVIKGKSRNVTADVYGGVQDVPEAPAESKYIEATGTFSEPLPYSGVAQAIAPAIGHVTERALITDAMNKMQERLGEHRDIIIDNHDSVGMSPLESIVFQNILNTESTRDVLKTDIPRETTKETIRRIEVKLRQLLSQDHVVMGPDSDFADLTDYFDLRYKRLMESESPDAGQFTDEKSKQSYKRRLIKEKKLLQSAYEKGLWSPKDPSIILGTKFLTKENANQSSFSVKPAEFVRWYVDNILKPARSGADKELINLGNDVQNLVEDMASVHPDKAAFMSSGR